MAGGLTCAANGPGLEVAANGGGFPANSRLDEPRMAAEIPRERRTRTSRGRRRCSISAKADLFVWSSLLSSVGHESRGNTRHREHRPDSKLLIHCLLMARKFRYLVRLRDLKYGHEE